MFQEDLDRQRFLSRLGELSDATGARILAWALLDNHVHLLLFSGPQGLSRLMRRLLTGYAVWYNRKYNRIGHLFQNRYKSIVCDEAAYLLELVRYIHLNPLRASVVKNIEELDHYPWSGHGVLIGKNKNGWQERGYILKQFSEERSRAIRAYRAFMKEGKDLGRRQDLVGGGLVRSLGGWSQVLALGGSGKSEKHDGRILGGEDFVEQILKEADKRLKRQLRVRGRKSLIDEVIERLCKKEGIESEELRRGGKRKKVSGVRARIAYHLNHEMGVPLAEIARHVGVCTSAVAKAIENMDSRNNK
jgi:REP element-mobilizing transposase RayT